jgi:hypothetical protein
VRYLWLVEYLFFICSHSASKISEAPAMPDLDVIQSEIKRMRGQIGRQRMEILQLQRAGIATASAEVLLQRMIGNLETLRAQRDRLKKEQPQPSQRRVLGGRRW